MSALMNKSACLYTRISCGVELLDGDLLSPTHTNTHPLPPSVYLALSSFYTQVEGKVTHISLAEGWHTCVYVSVPTPSITIATLFLISSYYVGVFFPVISVVMCRNKIPFGRM